MSTKHYCDLCGEEVKGVPNILHSPPTKYNNSKFSFYIDFVYWLTQPECCDLNWPIKNNIDLCKKCFIKELKETIEYESNS